jgi:hypothetical protein
MSWPVLKHGPPRWKSKELVSPLVIADYCEPIHTCTILPLSETGRGYMKAAGELLDQQILLHTGHKFKRRSNCEKCRNKIIMYSIYLRWLATKYIIANETMAAVRWWADETRRWADDDLYASNVYDDGCVTERIARFDAAKKKQWLEEQMTRRWADGQMNR